MLEATNGHPQILHGGIVVPAPRVLFRSFGDSALLFELRCFIRDINYKLDTISDLNYAITRLFHERGIEIPFPQRDLHLKSSHIGLPPMPARGEQGQSMQDTDTQAENTQNP